MSDHGVSGSTVPRRQLGRYLRDQRGQARLSVRAAAQALEWSEAKMWRIETGQTSMRSLDVEQMCRVYGAPADLTQALMGLAKETTARGWWHSYGDVIPEYFDLYIGLEESASSLQWYESELVPGLLQTEDYARTLIRAHKSGVGDDEIERLVQVRIARQALLTRVTAAPTVDIMINEAVLCRPVGSNSIMAAQIERLMVVSEYHNVSIRVIPFDAGLHYGVMSGPFVILRFLTGSDGRMAEPPTVYVEGLTGALYLDKPKEIERYEQTFEIMRDSCLGDRESKQRLLMAMRELGK